MRVQYPRKLRKGENVAIVSLSSGMLGEEFCSHNIEIGVRRLKEYGLEPVFMENALKGIKYLQEHPEGRAKDLKDAFMDDSIAGIICAIGTERVAHKEERGFELIQGTEVFEGKLLGGCLESLYDMIS